MTAQAKRWTWLVGVPGAALAAVTLILSLMVKPTAAAEVAPVANRVTAVEERQKALEDARKEDKELLTEMRKDIKKLLQRIPQRGREE